MSKSSALQLLVWKNAVIHRRQKLRLLFELVFPLCLMLILMWVRTHVPREFVHPCHFEEKALPSTGMFNFLRSTFCTFNNTCHSHPVDGASQKDNPINTALEFLDRFTAEHLNQKSVKALKNLKADIDTFSIFVKLITDPDVQLNETINLSDVILNPEVDDINTKDVTLLKSLRKAKLNLNSTSLLFDFNNGQILQNFCMNEDLIRKVFTVQNEDFPSFHEALSSLCNRDLFLIFKFSQYFNGSSFLLQISSVIETTTSRKLHQEEWQSLARLILDNFKILDWNSYARNLMASPKIHALQAAIENPVNETLRLLQMVLCGRNSSKLYDKLTMGPAQNFEEFEEDMKEHFSREKMEKEVNYVYDNTTTTTCNELFLMMETKTFLRMMWHQVKPFIRGKILYAPNSPPVMRIISKLRENFNFVSWVISSAKFWFSSVEPFIQQMLKQSIIVLDSISNLTSEKQNEIEKWLELQFNMSIQDFPNHIKTLKALHVHAVSVINESSKITRKAHDYLECFELNKFEPFRTEEEAIGRGLELVKKNTLWAVLIFEDIHENEESLPKVVRYKIRVDSGKVDSTKKIEDRVYRQGPRRRPAADLKYLTFGFAYIQDMIEHAIIQEQTKQPIDVGIYMKQFPHPCFIRDKFVPAISRFLPFFLVISWVYNSSLLIKSIVYEKEKGLKEVMKVMGLTNRALWLSWFFDAFTVMFITCLLLTFILHGGNIIPHCDPSLLFIFLLSQSITIILQSFFLSTLFSSSNIAAVVGGIVFFMTYIPYTFMYIWVHHLSLWHKLVGCLLPNVAFSFGCYYFAHYEEIGVGAQWTNFHQSPLPWDDFNLALVFLMFFTSSSIFILMTWYIEAAFPGKFGVPKPWYFPITKHYWCGYTNNNSNEDVVTQRLTGNGIEDEPTDLTLGISIFKLTKVFNNCKVAVNELSMNFYENQITSFLGHNGAGKTTTISILTGLLTPTSGTATIYGKSIQTDMDEIRKNLGTCPQHNVLFSNLTVYEHLWFYARLKALKGFNIYQDIEQMLQDVGLTNKRNDFAKNLSGGMQRKLSVAIAFIGGSKTVILDEPTAGVDPYSRRSIWELLLKYKKNRTIILTTHHMDEADLLGDRIAIISQGKLKCCGSSLYLKSQFGNGIYLTVVKDSDSVDQLSPQNAYRRKSFSSHLTGASTKKIISFVQKHIPQATLIEEIGSEIVILLPFPKKKSSALKTLLTVLDESLSSLGISSYGISDTTLEKVFLRVTHDVDEFANRIDSTDEEKMDENHSSGFREDSPFDLPNNCCGPESVPLKTFRQSTKTSRVGSQKLLYYTGQQLRFRQCFALYIKRFHHARRNLRAVVCEIILPIFYVCISILFTMILPPVSPEPPLVLDPMIYGPPNHVFFADSSQGSANAYVRELISLPALSARCINVSAFRSVRCQRMNSSYAFDALQNPVTLNQNSTCSCQSGMMECPAALGPIPSTILNSGDVVYNLSSVNISDWIFSTQRKLHKKRFGGFTFGYKHPSQSFNGSLWSSLFERIHAYDVGLAKSLKSFFKGFYDANKSSPLFENILVWFNNKGWVSSVGFLNAVNNIVLRSHLPAAVKDQYGIIAINHPLNYTQDQLKEEILVRDTLSLFRAFCILFAMSFVPASFVLYLIEDRVNGAKHLQFVSGLSPFLYWMCSFTWDLCMYLIPTALCTLILVGLGDESYVSAVNIKSFITLVVLYGFASIPFMYPVSFAFRIPSAAFITLVCANIIIGMITTTTTFMLDMFRDEDLQEVNNVLKKVFLIFPHYCLGRGLMDLSANHVTSKIFGSMGISINRNPFDWNYLGRYMVPMMVQGVVAFTLILCIEFILFQSFSFRKPHIPQTEGEDDDVKKERQRVLVASPENYSLLVKNLVKVYMGSKLPAVNRVCVAVKPGECFGLLGVNGAGKTTMFKMLTGDLNATCGEAYVCGYSMLREPKKARKHVGYCPQFDALDPLMTSKEHLEFYARIRGIKENLIPHLVSECIAKLQLQIHANTCAGTYSGGNKRKLSTAIALVGNPSIVFLDEPTTGMDPKARRFLWNCIIDVIKSGCCVILTSHSMEECETLCTRLAIMVSGQFKCLGSIQHLKSKYGKGYTVVIRVGQKYNVDDVKSHIQEKFGSRAVLKEKHLNQVKYEISSEVGLAPIFTEFDEAKDRLGIEDYSVCQTSLDQIFVDFAQDSHKKSENGSNDCHV